MKPTHRTALIALCLATALAATACQKSETQTSTSGTDATSQTQGVEVSRIDLGKSVGSDNRVTENVDAFHPNETIYASVVTTGSAPSAEIRTRFTFQDGQVVDESSRTIAPSGGEAATEFHISKPDGFPVGKYRVDVFVNGSQAGTKEFEVRTS